MVVGCEGQQRVLRRGTSPRTLPTSRSSAPSTRSLSPSAACWIRLTWPASSSSGPPHCSAPTPRACTCGTRRTTRCNGSIVLRPPSRRSSTGQLALDQEGRRRPGRQTRRAHPRARLSHLAPGERSGAGMARQVSTRRAAARRRPNDRRSVGALLHAPYVHPGADRDAHAPGGAGRTRARGGSPLRPRPVPDPRARDRRSGPTRQ